MSETTTPLGDRPVATRVFSPPPSDVLDPATRRPLVGSYAGPLPPVDYGVLGRSLPFRIAREKAWYYVAIASPEVFVGAAVLRFGYVASTFAFLLERGPAGGPSGHFLADVSELAPPFCAKYLGERGATFRLRDRRVRFEREEPAGAFDLEVALPGLRVSARVSGALVPPPVSVVAELGEGLVHVTEKRALLPVEGEAEVGGRRFSLDGALAGFDRSHGFLRRRTVWRWAYLLGRTEAGDTIAVNLVDGFVGEPECAVWIGDNAYPVGEGRFLFDPGRPLAPWRIRSSCGAVDLTFEPGDIHAEHQDLGLVKTRFIHPVGAFTGTVTIAGRAHVVTRALGVVENQDSTW
jgi:hypothetical protein